MADYKLKLEIDASVLQKQLETAFKKGFKFAGGGAGGAGGSSGVFNDPLSRNNKRMKKVYDKTHKLSLEQRKELEKHSYTLKTEYAKQKTLMRAQNIMLEKSGVQQQRTFRMIGQLLGGRMGGAGGAGMDRIITGFSNQRKGRAQVKATQQAYDDMAVLPGAKMGPRPEQEPNAYNAMADIGDRLKDSPIGEFLGSTKKTFDEKVPGAKKTGDIAGKVGSKIPQAVKIAGIGAALAGGAGLAKMIVDSSPMLKQMLKILNIGIMLILRPIGDFIGFMLRPLLLEFVTKVAVPAYREGAKMAKDLGPKFGKALLLLFTDLPGFFELAITNPILGSLEKTWINIVTALKNLGSLFGGTSVAENRLWKQEQYDLIDKKYPGLLDQGAIDEKLNPLSTGLVTAPVEIVDDDFMGPLNENQRYQTEAQEKTTTEVKNVGDKIAALPQQIADVVIGPLGDMFAGSLEHIVEGMNLPFVDVTTRKAEEAFDAARDLAKDLPGLPTARGSMAIEAEARAKENQTIQKSWEKRVDGFAKGNYEGLSDTAKKILAGADNYKAGKIGSGTAAQAGGVYGSYNPLSTCQMGGMAGTGEFEMIGGVKTEKRAWCADIGSMAGTGEFYQKGAIPTEILERQNFAAETREEMEAYTEAIKAANEHGTLVTDEYKLIVDKAQEAYEQQVLTTENAKNVKSSSDIIKSEFNVMESNVETMTVATKSMADNLNEQALYVASLLRKAANIKKADGGTRYKWAAGMASDLENGFGGSYNNQSVPNVVRSRYKVTFGDGTTHEQVMDPQSYAHIMKMYGTGQPYRGKTMLSVQKMAAGGLITEPVFGIGQRSGKGYLMGEAGPERVTPGTGQPNGTSGGNTFNITINASGIGDIERQLKPAILKMLKESTSRAGIV